MLVIGIITVPVDFTPINVSSPGSTGTCVNAYKGRMTLNNVCDVVAYTYRVSYRAKSEFIE